jgi:hypothetical protein
MFWKPYRAGGFGNFTSIAWLAHMTASMTARANHTLSGFRDMTWLGVRRARVYAVGMAIAWAVLLIIIIWPPPHNGPDHHEVPFGADYSSFWAASRLVLGGQPADVYVPALHRLAELPVLTKGYAAFFYPPPFLLLCVPFALLPFYPSLAIFLGVTGMAFFGVVWRILRTPWAIVAALAFPAVAINDIAGQNAFLSAAIIGTGLTILDQRPKLAGAILGLMVIKPHLAVAAPIALIVFRRWSALVFAGISALTFLVLSYAIFGWEVWAAFIASTQPSRSWLEQGTVGFAKLQSVFALARSLGINVPASYAIQGLVALAAVHGLIWARHRRVASSVERSLIVLASLTMTPFLLHYDLVLVALPLAWMLMEWTDSGFPPWAKLVMIMVFCLPAGYLLAGPVGYGPPTVFLFGTYLLWSVSVPRSGILPARRHSLPV